MLAALLDHDLARRAEGLGQDAGQAILEGLTWAGLGLDLGRLAAEICQTAARSACAPTQPRSSLVAQRLAEAIDDQLDAPAWRVLAAAAQG